MANIIALIIFSGSFIGLAFLVLKKISILATLPEETLQNSENLMLIKQNILQKTSQIGQAVLHNAGVGAGRFKTIFANRIITKTQEEIEKVEKIHKEGDYWQKVEERKLPNKKISFKKPRVEIIEASTTEIIEIKETDPQAKKIRIKKKKVE